MDSDQAEASTPVLITATVDGLGRFLGTVFGPTNWYAITQVRLDAFNRATDPARWTRASLTDGERQDVSCPYGQFALSLGPMFMNELMAFEGFVHSLNYGYETVRYSATLPIGSHLRMRASIVDVAKVTDGTQATIEQTFELEHDLEPVCTAVSIRRFIQQSTGR